MNLIRGVAPEIISKATAIPQIHYNYNYNYNPKGSPGEAVVASRASICPKRPIIIKCLPIRTRNPSDQITKRIRMDLKLFILKSPYAWVTAKI